MKLLCREDHNGGASRSDVGDRRSKLFDVFHDVVLLMILCRRIACRQKALVAVERSRLAFQRLAEARSRARGL
jgi:hypothetical protein